MRTLILLRHATAGSPLGMPDIERPLAGCGRRDARVVGDRLRAAGRLPDRVVCSPALRTRQTLAELALDTPVDIEPLVYDNDAEAILELLRVQRTDPATLLLVGHNPAMHRLAADLTGAVPDGFPPSATAMIEFDGEWTGLWPGTGRLTTLWIPRG